MAPGVLAALALAGLVGGLLLIASEFTPLIRIVAGGHVVQQVSGHSQHSFGLLLAGLAALPLLWVALRTRSRAAAAAVLALGALAIGIAAGIDIPDAHGSGIVQPGFRRAHAEVGPGVYLETLGGILMILSAGITLILTTARPRLRRRARPAAGAAPPSTPGP